MAQDAVNAILEGLKTHQAKVLEQTRLAIEKQRADAQTEAEKARIEQQKAQLEQAKKEFDLNHEIAKKHADLVTAQVTSQLGNQYQQTGVAPAGTSVSPTIQGNGGMASPVNPQQATSQMLDIPNVGQIQVATPEQYATRQADLSRITEKPKEEAKIRESQALQSDLLKKQEEAKQADFVRAIVQKQYDDNRAAASQTAETERAKLHIASAERIARIQAAARDKTTGIDLSPFAQDAIDGKITKEEVARLPVTMQEKAAIVDAVRGTGSQILRKDQADLVGDMNQVVSTIPLMDQVIQNQPQTHNVISSHIGGLLSSGNQDVTAPEKELMARTSVISRFLKEKGNLSNRDIERVTKMIPSRFNPLETNIKLRDDFRLELNKLLDSKLANLPDAQRNIIKKRVGLLDIAPYGAVQQAAPGGSQQSTLSPAAQQLMQKYGIQ